jgi:hypothetical protein
MNAIPESQLTRTPVMHAHCPAHARQMCGNCTYDSNGSQRRSIPAFYDSGTWTYPRADYYRSTGLAALHDEHAGDLHIRGGQVWVLELHQDTALPALRGGVRAQRDIRQQRTPATWPRVHTTPHVNKLSPRNGTIWTRHAHCCKARLPFACAACGTMSRIQCGTSIMCLSRASVPSARPTWPPLEYSSLHQAYIVSMALLYTVAL